MSILQFDRGQGVAPQESTLAVESFAPTRVVLQSASDFLDRWSDELARFEFKLKDKPDPLLHLAELTVLPCAYACFKADIALSDMRADELQKCPLGISSREEKKYKFRFHTKEEIHKKLLTDELQALRSQFMSALSEVKIKPIRSHYTLNGNDDPGFYIGSLLREITEGDLLPYGVPLNNDINYPITDWAMIDSRSLGLNDERYEKQSITDLYSFLWRGPEFAHLQDPISSVNALASRLGFESSRVKSDAVVIWDPSAFLPEHLQVSHPSVAGILVEKNGRDNFFRSLLVTWLHHSTRGRSHSKSLGLSD